jgi:O-antigen/teichoic acid export membrane protein
MGKSLRRGLAFGFASQVAGRLLVMCMSVFSTAILARLLEPKDFGTMSIALGIVALADSIFDGAFGINIVNRQEVDRNYIASTLNVSILFAALLSLALFLSADIWERIVGFHNLAIVLKVLSLTLVIKAAGMVSRNLLLRDRRLFALSTSSVTAAFIGNIVVSCGLALNGFGLWSLVWGAVVAVAVETGLNLAQARPTVRLSISRSIAREVVGTGSLYTISQILNWAMNSGSGIVSARALGPVDLGFYSRGNKLLELTTSAIGEPMMRVFFPSFARLKENRIGAREMLVRALSSSSLFFSIASVLLAVHSDLIVKILLGAKWGQTATVGQILFLSLLPRCNYKITESAAFGLGAASLAVKRQAIFAGVTLTAVAIGSRWGVMGVATGVAIGIWLNYFVSLTIAARLVGVSVWRLVSLHAAPVAFAFLLAVIDKFVIVLTVSLGVWPSQISGGLTAVIIALLVIGVAPGSILPEDVARIRNRVLLIKPS